MINHALTKKLIGFLVLLNVLFLVAYVFVYFKVSASEKEAATVYANVGINEQGRESLNNLKRGIESTQDEREKLSTYFVSEDEVVTFLERVEELGKVASTSLHLTGIHKSDDKKDSYVELSLEVQGTFQEVFHYLSLIENLPYKVSFTKVFLEKGSERREVLSSAFSGNSVAMQAPASQDAQDLEQGNKNMALWKATVMFRLESFDLKN